MRVFENPGSANTDETCRIAIKRAAEINAPIVSATTTGAAGARLCEIAGEMNFQGKIVVVTHAAGFVNPGETELQAGYRAAMEEKGAVIVTATHSLSGVERAMSRQFQGTYPAEIIAHSLRILSAGVKVSVEISSMALDSGAIPYGVPVVCVAGTRGGLDTAVIMHPAHSNAIFDAKINEILCMPY